MRKDSCRCSKCLKEHWREPWRARNIVYVRKHGSIGAVLKCNSCGHTYRSSSIAAIRRRKSAEQEIKS